MNYYESDYWDKNKTSSVLLLVFIFLFLERMGDRIIRKVEAGAERLSKKVENHNFTNINKNNKIFTINRNFCFLPGVYGNA